MHLGDFVKKILIFLFLPILIIAQSEFINDGHLGIGANYGYVANDILSGSGGSFGISALGKYDMGAEFIDGMIELDNSNIKINSSSFLFYLAYNVKRNNNFSNLKIMAGFIKTSFGYYISNEEENSGFVLGLSFSLKALEEKNISIIPALGLIYGFIDTDLNQTYYIGNGYYYTRKDSFIENTRNLSLEVNFKVQAIENMNFIITPSISKDLISSDNSISYSILGGLMFDFEIE